MYKERSTLAHPASKITFNGVSHDIPVKVHVLNFFKGMKGYFSENFNMGIIVSKKINLKLIQKPKNLSIGEKWLIL